MAPLRLGALTVAAPDTPAPPHPDAGDPGVFTWYNLDGSLWGHGFRADGGRWLSFPGVGRFLLGASGGAATAVPDDGVAVETTVDAYRRFVLPMALHANGVEVLHASAVVHDGRVFALCAPAKTGKSTTAFALGLRGHELWADDAVAFELRAGAPVALAQPFRLRLRRTAGEYFDRRVPPEAFDAMLDGSLDTAPATLPFGGLVLLERSDTLTVASVGAADALRPVLEQAYWYDLSDPLRKRELLERYTQLVAVVPIWSARFPAGFDAIDALVDALEEAFAAA